MSENNVLLEFQKIGEKIGDDKKAISKLFN